MPLTRADILGLFAAAMSAQVGARVGTQDYASDLQLLYRTKRACCPDLPLAFVRGLQADPSAPREIWIVHSRFMTGKTFDVESARRELEALPRDAG